MLLRRSAWTIARYALISIAAVLMLIPLAWALSGSFHSNASIFASPFAWLPSPPQLQNYGDSLARVNFGTLLFNSFFIGFVIAIGSVVFGLMAGYALAKRTFIGRNVIFWGVVATLLIPFPSIMIGVFIIATRLGITDSYAGVILPGILTGQVVFFMRQFLQGIPDELLESARIDGANEWKILWQIVVPMAWPVMISMGILTFVGSWNNLLWPLIVIQRTALYTIPLGLTSLQSEYSTNYVGILAVSVIAIVPVVLLYLMGRRRLLDSVMVSGGALKG